MSKNTGKFRKIAKFILDRVYLKFSKVNKISNFLFILNIVQNYLVLFLKICKYIYSFS